MNSLFERVFVRPPSEDYPNCNSTNPDKEGIDLVLAKNQHGEYISILKESAIDVLELPVLNGHPDSVFLQDPAVVGRNVTVVGRFGLHSRAGEETAMIDNLNAGHWETGTPRFITAPGQLEGGDVLITDTTIFVGVSSRTNKEGILQRGWRSDMSIIPCVRSALTILQSHNSSPGCPYASKEIRGPGPSYEYSCSKQ